MTQPIVAGEARNTAASAPAGEWIGIDWGTTHRRALRLVAGQVAGEVEDAQGLTACAPHFASSLDQLLHGLGAERNQATIVMSGMVGSASGWQEVPYLDAGTPLSDLPGRLQRLARSDAPPAAWIVPGVCWRGERGAVDVMRGEETQLFGAMHLLGGRSDGWYLLPGTHSKWVELREGRVQWLHTYLSGELFALLREHGTLSAIMRSGHAVSDADAQERAAFERGVAASAEAALSHALFAARAQVVTGGLAAACGAAFVSGALFGTEWHDMAGQLAHASPVRVIGAARLCAHHVRCAALLGFATEVLDSKAVQRAAWLKLREEGPR